MKNSEICIVIIMKIVANASRAITARNNANASRAFPFFSFEALVTFVLSQKVILIHEIFMKNPEICKESYEKCD